MRAFFRWRQPRGKDERNSGNERWSSTYKKAGDGEAPKRPNAANVEQQYEAAETANQGTKPLYSKFSTLDSQVALKTRRRSEYREALSRPQAASLEAHTEFADTFDSGEKSLDSEYSNLDPRPQLQTATHSTSDFWFRRQGAKSYITTRSENTTALNVNLASPEIDLASLPNDRQERDASTAAHTDEIKQKDFSHSLPEWVENIVSVLVDSEPLVPPGHTRIRWKCRCNQKLFDGFIEMKPGSLKTLQTRLQEQNGTRTPTNQQVSSSQGLIQAMSQPPRKLLFWKNQGTVQVRSTTNNRRSGLPLHDLRSQPLQPWANQKLLHLLMWVDSGEVSTQLHQNRIQRVTDDGELFRFLRKHYFKHRDFVSWFTLRSVRSLSLVWFKVDERVNNEEYQCHPAPQTSLEYFLAIECRELTHYFKKPHAFKRACGQLRASSDEARLD
ncbi:hypothetical protein EDB81DRAFT_764302 [Dactylonectria macrodidyma]|uniref:Uncharacterized protein n=1 Tax=Dactylonectria macrodidyma TaxID=307937 RepID=A0A9P9INK3_9HYPO|nr:hypothetical protein EDB81DRAFT_764302 [Dactylonectria macrodidyma]